MPTNNSYQPPLPTNLVVTDTLRTKWQQMVNLITEVYHVPVGVITHIHDQVLEILVSSNTPHNPYPAGMVIPLNSGVYCETTIATNAQLYIQDARLDPIWLHSPELTHGLISYLGVPLQWSDGTPFGTVCVLSDVVRDVDHVYKDLMWQFKYIIEGDLRLQMETYQREQLLEQRVKERTHALSHANACLEREIAERQRTEQTLREQEQFLRSIYEGTTISIFVVDVQPDGSMHFAGLNPMHETLTGVTDNDLRGKAPHEILPPDVAVAVTKHYAACVHAGKPISYEEHIPFNGNNSWWITTLTPLFAEDQRIFRLVGTSINISERKAMEEALRQAHHLLEERVAKRTQELSAANDALHQSKQLLQDVIDQLPSRIFIKDSHGHFLLVNQQFAASLGYQPDDLIDLPEVNFFPPTIVKQWQEQDSHIITHGTSLDMEMELSEMGELRTFWVRKFPLCAINGDIYAVGGMATDITERKHTEQDLHRAREAAEAATHAKSAFLANMSHEIRTPMNAVIGMTNLLLDTPLTTEQREFVDTIRLSGDTLLTLINDILDFSKIEANRLEIEALPFRLSSCIEEALDLIHPQAADKGLDLAYFIDEQVPIEFVGDNTRLRQILVNLLSNGVKFTHKGEIVVSVVGTTVPADELTYKIPSGCSFPTDVFRLHISVHDTGIGIPVDRQQSLFQSFSQGDPSTTRKYGGTGLGLVISKRLAEMMGGTMWFDSTEGVGSTFHFSLVMQAVAHQETESALSQQSSSALSTSSLLIGKNILIVENSPTARYFLSYQTRSWGLSTWVVSTAMEALHWVEQDTHFDMAIIALHLPDIDGITLAKKIHAMRPTLSLVLLVPSTLRDAVLQQLPPSSSTITRTILTKPIKPSNLYNALIAMVATEEELHDHLAQLQMMVPGRGSSQWQQTSTKLRILLAEDNVINQKVALSMLKRMNYRADIASNGLEVLDAIEHHKYDVILMDVQMPDMDGIETTHHIRSRLPKEQQPWIIAVTAHAMQGDREWVMHEGMDDYIGKPIQMDQLFDALQKVPQKIANNGTDTTAINETAHTAHTDSSATPNKHQTVPVAAISTPAIDTLILQDFLSMVSNDDPTMARDMVDLFISTTESLVAELQQCSPDNHQQITQIAHSLKSSSAQVGAVTLSAQCKEVEALGRTGKLVSVDVPQMVEQIAYEFSRVCDVLEPLVQQISS